MQAVFPTHTAARNPARNVLYLLGLTPGLVTIAGNLLGGPWALANWAFSFVVLAALERLTKPDLTNAYDEDETLPNLVLAGYVVIQTLTVGTLVYGIYAGILTGPWVWAAALSTGIHSGSAGITVGHELLHRKEKYWQLCAKWLLFLSGNPYFLVAHLRTHHRLVATLDDSTTARLNENLYAFSVRSVAGQMRDCLRYEAERLRKAGRAPYGLMNYGVGNLVGMAALTALLWGFIGWQAAAAFVLQGVIADFLLEYINYIQHYGLQRAQVNGVYEKVNEHHSWQSDHATRFFLVDLSRHSDHHANGAKHYPRLQHYDASPALPTGYSGMIYLALVPPLFYRVMNPKVAALTAP